MQQYSGIDEKIKYPHTVFYDPRQTSPVPVSSPSATKPALLIKQWQERGYLLDIRSFDPATREDFYLVHDKDHVNAVLDCVKPNGLHNTNPLVAATFPWTTGSMVAAALHAWKNKIVTCSPVSGFHHATHKSCQGFCTFNGLMVATMKLLQAGAKKVGIVDCDCHYGNGTDDILDRFSLRNMVLHYTFGQEDDYNPVWAGDERAEAWLQRFPSILNTFKDCDIILYQAGADAHAEDPLGGALTTEQMKQRDRLVFTTFATLGIPVTWNLAGGYTTPIKRVLDLHTITLHEATR